MRIFFRMMAAATAFALTMGATPGQAAAIITAGGVDNLLVGTTLYDVEFHQGTCFDLFDGCDELADFSIGPATTVRDAMFALEAFFESIKGGPFPDFCTSSQCSIRAPDSFTGIPEDSALPLTYFLFLNRGFSFEIGSVQLEGPFPWPAGNAGLYAKWSVSAPVSPVPLPASFLLMATGFAGLTVLYRRKRRAV